MTASLYHSGSVLNVAGRDAGSTKDRDPEASSGGVIGG